MRYTFKFKLFGKKVQMFSYKKMGLVIEKEPDVVCVYATDETHQNIMCAIPLYHPKLLKMQNIQLNFSRMDKPKFVLMICK